MSVISNSLREFKASLATPLPPPSTDHASQAREQVAQLGDQPTPTQLTALMVTMLNENKYESKLSRDLLSQHLGVTMSTVAQHDTDISELKENMTAAGNTINQFSNNQSGVINRLIAAEQEIKKANIIAAEQQQRSIKGHFILSGELIPHQTPNEDLYQLLFPVIFQKYGVYIYLHELRALHRLPNNRIFFSILTYMPGQNYENLMRAVNANPEPHLRLYVTSQLVPYFSELYFIARKLKNLKVINRYNLDNNGNTHIALAEHLMAFKFTGLDQLRQLKVSVPQQLIEEIARSGAQITQNQTRAAELNLQKASQPRPNYVPRPDPSAHPHQELRQVHTGQPSPRTPPVLTPVQPTGQRYPTVPSPLVPPAHVLGQPPPNFTPNLATNPRTANSGQFRQPSQTHSHPPHRPSPASDGRPPPSKYQRPSYSPASFPPQAPFRRSPASSAPVRFSAPSPSAGGAGSTPRSRLWSTNFNTVSDPIYF